MTIVGGQPSNMLSECKGGIGTVKVTYSSKSLMLVIGAKLQKTFCLPLR